MNNDIVRIRTWLHETKLENWTLIKKKDGHVAIYPTPISSRDDDDVMLVIDGLIRSSYAREAQNHIQSLLDYIDHMHNIPEIKSILVQAMGPDEWGNEYYPAKTDALSEKFPAATGSSADKIVGFKSYVSSLGKKTVGWYTRMLHLW